MLKKLFCLFLFCASPVWSLTCSNPTPVFSFNKDNLSDYRLVANAKGDRAVLLEIENKEQEQSIQLVHKTESTAWSAPVLLSSWYNSVSLQDAKINGQGQVSACWNAFWFGLRTFRPRSNQEWVTWTPEQGLIVPHTFSDNEGCSLDSAVTEQGDFFTIVQKLALQNDFSINSSLSLVSFDAKGKIEQPLSPSNAFDKEACLFSDLHGKIAAVYTESETSEHRLKCCLHAEGQWNEPALIATSSSPLEIGHLAINQKDFGALSWTNDENALFVSIYSNGAWSTETSLSSEKKVSDSIIAVDEQNNLLICGEDLEEKEMFAWYKGANEEWLQVNVPLPKFESLEAFKIQNDDKGHFVAIWSNKTEEETAVYAAVFSTQTKSWSDAVRLSPKEKNCTEPQFVMTGKGNGILIWLEEVGEDVTVLQAMDLRNE